MYQVEGVNGDGGIYTHRMLVEAGSVGVPTLVGYEVDLAALGR